MAMVNVSLDTTTRQVILTINGMLVSANDVSIDKYTFDDGDESISFSYTIENVDGSGMRERRQFSLPSPTTPASEAGAAVDDNGLVSKSVLNQKKAAAGLAKFLKPDKKV